MVALTLSRAVARAVRIAVHREPAARASFMLSDLSMTRRTLTGTLFAVIWLTPQLPSGPVSNGVPVAASPVWIKDPPAPTVDVEPALPSFPLAPAPPAV